jgi:hypothetical protein
MKPLINILIRHTEGREKSYYKALDSVATQTYKNVRVVVGYDFSSSHFSIPGDVFDVFLKTDKSLGPYFYNDYCNALKTHVSDGWFFFLDDDDYLANGTVLEELSKHFDDDYHAIVCQMSRANGKIKPNDDLIKAGAVVSGRIGLPCLILRSRLHDIANVPATENGDFSWIWNVVERVPTKFINHVVVHSPQRNFGR